MAHSWSIIVKQSSQRTVKMKRREKFKQSIVARFSSFAFIFYFCLFFLFPSIEKSSDRKKKKMEMKEKMKERYVNFEFRFCHFVLIISPFWTSALHFSQRHTLDVSVAVLVISFISSFILFWRFEFVWFCRCANMKLRRFFYKNFSIQFSISLLFRFILFSFSELFFSHSRKQLTSGRHSSLSFVPLRQNVVEIAVENENEMNCAV